MGCKETCPATELTGLAEQNIAYCQGLVDVVFDDSDLEVHNACGAFVMAKVSYGEIKPREVRSVQQSDQEEVSVEIR